MAAARRSLTGWRTWNHIARCGGSRLQAPSNNLPGDGRAHSLLEPSFFLGRRACSGSYFGSGNPSFGEDKRQSELEPELEPPEAAAADEPPPEQEKKPSADGDDEDNKSLSYFGISSNAFSEEINRVLMTPLDPQFIEIKSDGLTYFPEIRYRRVLNQAFGPGGWALMPRGEPKHFQSETETAQLVIREYALYCLGRFISQATGEHTYYSKTNLNYGRALESAKSNALMRCCKDIGIANELWDPTFVSEWKAKYAGDTWCENIRTKERKKLWRKRTSREPFPYPWKEIKEVKPPQY